MCVQLYTRVYVLCVRAYVYMYMMCYACICVMRAVRPSERHQSLAQVPLLLPPATIIRHINYTDIVPGQPNTQSARCAVRNLCTFVCAYYSRICVYACVDQRTCADKTGTQDRVVCDKLLFPNHLSTDYPNLKSCSGLLFNRWSKVVM